MRRISFGRIEKQHSQVAPLKILILGTENAGKSSWFRAIKVASGLPWTTEELDTFRHVIYANILQVYYQTIKYFRQQSLPPSLKNYDDKMLRIEKICESEMSLQTRATLYYDVHVSDIVRELFDLDEFRSVLLEKAGHTEGISRFFTAEHLRRISPPDYTPTEQDILQAYRPTGGVDISKIKLDGVSTRIFDLSGHRSEQERWHHSCDNVDVLYYVASLAEYNKYISPLSESSDELPANLLKRSLHIFENTIRNIGFHSKTLFILILNKKDVIVEKFDPESLKEEFEGYSGSNLPNDGIDFICNLYKESFERAKGKQSEKELHIFVTSSISVNDVKETFEKTKILISERQF